MTESIATPFAHEDLVAYANAILAENGSKVRATAVRGIGDRHVEFDGVAARGGRAKLVAPMGSQRQGVCFFRSILKVRDPSTACGWLVGGQAGTNAEELVHLGESGPLLATSRDRLRAFLERGAGSVPNEKVAAFRESVERAMGRADEEGLVGGEVEVIRWDGEWTRTPIRPDPAAAAPSP